MAGVSDVQTTPAAPVCCGGPGSSPLDRPAAEDAARLLKAVADPVRLQLISLVGASEAGEVCACDLPAAVDLSQPTVSHHLKVLTEAGVLVRERRGNWAWFSLDRDRLRQIAAILGG